MAISDKTLEAIKESGRTYAIEVSDSQYLTQPVFLPPLEPRAHTLEVATLTGIVDFVKADLSEGNAVAIHVEGPRSVTVVSALRGRGRCREEYCRAKLPTTKFPFDEYIDNEMFIIKLQSMFIETETTEKILQVVGTIKEQHVKTHTDDGRTQTVVASAGIVSVQEVDVPNPVLLQPYRTFGEIGQPESLFVLRMRQTNTLPQIALYEADGGEWKLEAIQGIADYLKEALKKSNIQIIA